MNIKEELDNLNSFGHGVFGGIGFRLRVLLKVFLVLEHDEKFNVVKPLVKQIIKIQNDFEKANPLPSKDLL